ncbi:MAG: DNA cytosine methyltransferase [Campylobacter sp.]
MQNINLATLFSGVGTAEIAAKRVLKDKFKSLFACEIDKFARKSYLANNLIDEVNFYKDIKELDAKLYLNKVDILIGGSPCQDFSMAGLRAGVKGKCGSLIWQYCRIIDECRPRIFIYENVKGMLNDRGGKTLKEFLKVFRKLGYFCHTEIINTKNYDIPQSRERIYIIGFLDSKIYHSFSLAPKQPLKLNLSDMLESDVNKKYFLNKRLIECFKKKDNNFNDKFKPAKPSETPNCISTTNKSKHTNNFIKVVGKLDIKARDSIKRVYDESGLSPTLTTSGGGHRTPKIIQRARGYNKGGEFEICPTISTSSFENNNLLDEGFRIRKLTPRECFRLQGFSDDFKIIVSDTQAYKQAGNAMSLNVIEMILRQIFKGIEK